MSCDVRGRICGALALMALSLVAACRERPPTREELRVQMYRVLGNNAEATSRSRIAGELEWQAQDWWNRRTSKTHYRERLTPLFQTWPSGDLSHSDPTNAPFQVNAPGRQAYFSTPEGDISCAATFTAGRATMRCTNSTSVLVCTDHDCRAHPLAVRPDNRRYLPLMDYGERLRLGRGLLCMTLRRAIACRRTDRTVLVFGKQGLMDGRDDPQHVIEAKAFDIPKEYLTPDPSAEYRQKMPDFFDFVHEAFVIDRPDKVFAFRTPQADVACLASYASRAQMECTAHGKRFLCDPSDCRAAPVQRAIDEIRYPIVYQSLTFRLGQGMTCLTMEGYVVCRRPDGTRFGLGSDNGITQDEFFPGGPSVDGPTEYQLGGGPPETY